MKKTVYLNLYRCGVYHRQGKPNTTNLHAGDVYVSERTAMENAEPDRGYITTVPAILDIPEGTDLYVNPEGSVPTPLSVTHHKRDDLLPYLVHTGPQGEPGSIETSEAEAHMDYVEWQRQLLTKAATYRPVHGGYPEPQAEVLHVRV